MSFIDTIQPDQAEGELKEIYDDLIKSRGKIAEVHKIQSLNPESIVNHMELYMTIMFGKSPLRRVHREMMAVIVSISNKCEYCQVHHLEAVKNFWRDDQKLDAFQVDFEAAPLDEKEKSLCRFAKELTENPEKSEDAGLVKPLKKAGFTDREILDATLVIAYFNFVNRIVLGLGVNLEENPGGYKYD
ncbi:peroxidase-related enzyme [Ekhidna sp. To15]|uniref:peroxidase-related enzyme n=1 Tax=Ekhidna sp. To15 TaxID=3395267 RepID=UPI003F51F15E